MRFANRLGPLLAPAALVLALPAAAAIPRVKIADVTVSPTTSVDQPCPVTLTFRATVLLDMRSKFTYEWKVSTGEADRQQHPPIESDGVNPVVLTQEWTLGERKPKDNPYQGWVKLYVRSPEQKLSEPAVFTIDCGPPPPTADGKAR
jgi:hypothetical protein